MLSEENKERIITFLTKQGIAILISIGFLCFVAWQNVQYTIKRDADMLNLKTLVQDQQKTIQQCAVSSAQLTEAIKQSNEYMRIVGSELSDIKRELKYK